MLKLLRLAWFLAYLLLTFGLYSAPVQAAITYISSSSGRVDTLPTNGTAGNLTINKPVGVAAGQALIASIAARPRSMTYTAPTDWILMTTTQQTQGGTTTSPGGMTLLTFYKIVGTTEPASYTWTFANSTLNQGGSAVGGILAFSGIDTSTSPIDVFSANLTNSGLTHSTTSINTTVANTMIVSSISFLSASNFAAPTGITGITEILDQSAPLATQAVGTTLQMSIASKGAAGATGSSQATAAGQSDNGIGHLMALRASLIDPSITMTRTAALFPGGTGSYSLTVTNLGNNSEPGALTVTDTLPTGLSYASSSGTGWSCGASGQLVTCTRTGAIAAGASAPTLVINVNVSSTATGTVTNSATVNGTGADGNTNNNTAVDSFTFPSPYAYYMMDETTWGTVTDSSGNGRNASALGAAVPTGSTVPSPPGSAITGSPGTCGAGSIPTGTATSGVNTNIDPNSIGNSGTIMFWYSSNESWNTNNRILFDASNDLSPTSSGSAGNTDKHFFLAKNNSGGLVFALEDTSDTDSTATSSNNNFSANQWHHIAVTWDLSADNIAVYLDGNATAVVTSTTNVNGTLGDMATLYFGTQRMANVAGTPSGYTNNTTNGYIDEARIFQGALSGAEIAYWKGLTHTCPASSTGTVAANFNCIESIINSTSASTGHLYTKLAGTAFSFDVVALKADGTVETSYVSGSNTKNVTVELVDGSSSATCTSRTALSPAVSQSLSFVSTNQGRKTIASTTVSNAYANVYCKVTDANQSPSVVACSSDNFAIRPTSFTVTSSNANADSTGVSASATPVISAGANFALSAAALNAASAAAVGYNLTPQLDNTKLVAHTGAVQTGALSGSFGAAASATGIATGSAFTYSEVGYFNLATNGVYDSSFATVDSAASDCTADYSNALVSGKYGCNFGNTAATVYFGRFVPDHFRVVSSISNACTSGTFTYMGQPFTLSQTNAVEARNLSDVKTQNYAGSFARGTVLYGAENSDNGVDLSSRLTLPSGSWTAGSYTLASASGTFSRPTSTTSDATWGSFEALDIGLTVSDSDVTTIPKVSSADMNPSVAGGSSFAYKKFTGSPLRMRYGRLNLQNAFGSELLPLSVSLTSQYWNGSAFVTNTDDACTAITAPTNGSGLTFYSEVAATTPGNHLGPTETTASVSATNKLVAGDAQLKFTAPGSGNDGYFDISITAPDFLKFNWNATTAGDENPSGRATFGIYKSNDSQIYIREVY